MAVEQLKRNWNETEIKQHSVQHVWNCRNVFPRADISTFCFSVLLRARECRNKTPFCFSFISVLFQLCDQLEKWGDAVLLTTAADDGRQRCLRNIPESEKLSVLRWSAAVSIVTQLITRPSFGRHGHLPPHSLPCWIQHGGLQRATKSRFYFTLQLFLVF